MNGRTFSPNPRKRGKSHRHHIWISQSPVPRSDPTWLKPCDNKTVQSQIALVSIPVLFMLNNMLSAFWMYLCWNTISCLSLATSISQLWQQWLRIRDSAPFHHVQGCGAWQKTFAYFFFFSAQTLTHSISVISFSSRMLARYRVHDTLWQSKESEREVSYFHVKKLSFLDYILFPEGLV